MSVKDIRKSVHNFVFGSGDLSKTSNFDSAKHVRGEVLKMFVTLPDWANTVTAVVTGINQADKEIFASDSMAQNEEYDITLSRNEFLLFGVATEQLKVTLSGVPGSGGGTAEVTVSVDR
jgi:hypothetical protein